MLLTKNCLPCLFDGELENPPYYYNKSLEFYRDTFFYCKFRTFDIFVML